LKVATELSGLVTEESFSNIDLTPDDPGYEDVIELVKAEQAQQTKDQVYSDKYLIEILKKAGLWSIFKDKDGLDTLIGEGGLNLSGGQRQRLNFSSLFLRAKYFKPEVILIDEPTSSLDEISEKAITDMISNLAENSLTLVIAHRLNTLEKSVGILDLSLLEEEKELTFYPKEQLVKKSVYYQKLIRGELSLDE
jgi:ABC-type multidrug transport system fused ATPase/permease subunit